MWDMIRHFFANLGLFNLQGSQVLMVLIGVVLILLAVARRRDTLLLVALGFGIVVGNMPSSPAELGWFGQRDVIGLRAIFQDLLNAQILPTLVFLGIGALTDFTPLIASPRLAILGGGAQVGIFFALLLATLLGFGHEGAAVAAAVAGAHSPLAIFAASTLAPRLIGAAAIVAYLCSLAAPVVLLPVMNWLTTPAERRIRMASPRPVSRKMRVLFPVLAFILCMTLAPTMRGVLGMLFLGNLLRESGVTERLSRTIGRTFTDIVTVLLAFGVGVVTSGEALLSWATLGLFIVGFLGFALAAGWGILMAKLMNLFGRRKINPLLGAAAVGVAPAAARVAHRLAVEEDPENPLLRQAMAPNLAATIALALSIGVMLSMLE